VAADLDFFTQIVKITMPPGLSMVGSLGNTNGAHARGYQPVLNMDINGAKADVIQVPGAGFVNFGANFKSWSNNKSSLSFALGGGANDLAVFRRTLGTFNTSNSASDLITFLSAFDGVVHYTGSFTGSAPGTVTSAVQFIASIALGSTPGANAFDFAANSPWVQIVAYGAEWDSLSLRFITGPIKRGAGPFGFIAKNPTAKSPCVLDVGTAYSQFSLLGHFGGAGQDIRLSSNNVASFELSENPHLVKHINAAKQVFP
jgi:hypothetical protein